MWSELLLNYQIFSNALHTSEQNSSMQFTSNEDGNDTQTLLRGYWHNSFEVPS